MFLLSVVVWVLDLSKIRIKHQAKVPIFSDLTDKHGDVSRFETQQNHPNMLIWRNWIFAEPLIWIVDISNGNMIICFYGGASWCPIRPNPNPLPQIIVDVFAHNMHLHICLVPAIDHILMGIFLHVTYNIYIYIIYISNSTNHPTRMWHWETAQPSKIRRFVDFSWNHPGLLPCLAFFFAARSLHSEELSSHAHREHPSCHLTPTQDASHHQDLFFTCFATGVSPS